MRMDSRARIRAAHEQHVTGHAGCQWYEVLLALYPVFPATIFLATLAPSTHDHRLLQGRTVLEVLVVVVPIVAAQTFANDLLVALAVFLSLAAAVAYTFSTSPAKNVVVETSGRDGVTLVRSIVGLSTAVAILAVDFHVFPRRFAKTEEFGWSLMDVGAAGFLLINALVDMRPNAVRSVRTVLRETCVLLALGCARLLSLPAIDYQQHASEYGVHCNFFFVLAFTKIICGPWCWSVSAAGAAAAACCCTALQHCCTALLQDWVFSSQLRDSLVSGNREAVVGATGYVALYCWGAALGKVVLRQKSGGTAYEHSARSLARGCAVAAAGAGAVLWLLVSVLRLQPSRRLVNAPFIIWMVFVFLLFTGLASSVEAALKARGHNREVVPRVLRAINKHQLLFFLAANIMTGLINLSTDTLSVRPPWDLLIIFTYTASLCCAVMLLQGYMTAQKTA